MCSLARRRVPPLVLAVLLGVSEACAPGQSRPDDAPAEATATVLTDAQPGLREQIVCRAMAYQQLARDIGGRRPLVMAGAEDLGRPDVPAAPCDSQVWAGLRLSGISYIKPWAAEDFGERGEDGVLRVELAEARDSTDRR